MSLPIGRTVEHGTRALEQHLCITLPRLTAKGPLSGRYAIGPIPLSGGICRPSIQNAGSVN